MVKYVFGGTLMGGVLVILGGILVGTNVNVTSSNNHQHYGSGRHILQIDETDDGTTYTVVDSETGSARLFHEEDGTVLLEGVPDDSDSR